MTTLTVKQAKDQLGDVVDKVCKGQRIVISQRGRKVAVVPLEDVKLLKKLQDKLDAKVIRARKKEPTLPWAKVKQDLGMK